MPGIFVSSLWPPRHPHPPCHPGAGRDPSRDCATAARWFVRSTVGGGNTSGWIPASAGMTSCVLRVCGNPILGPQPPLEGEGSRVGVLPHAQTYPSSPLMFALHYPPAHHSGLTGGAAATSGRGDAIAGASLLLRVRVVAVGDERSPARLPNHSKNWQPRDDYRLTYYKPKRR